MKEYELATSDPFLPQTINQKIFESMMMSRLADLRDRDRPGASDSQSLLSLTSQEENALRYAAGYVPINY